MYEAIQIKKINTELMAAESSLVQASLSLTIEWHRSTQIIENYFASRCIYVQHIYVALDLLMITSSTTKCTVYITLIDGISDN